MLLRRSPAYIFFTVMLFVTARQGTSQSGMIERGSGGAPDSRPPMGSGAASGIPRTTSAALPVAMRGFSPVALVDQREWKQGSPEHQVAVDGKNYWLASEAELRKFATLTEKYVPVLGGDCIVEYAQSGRRVAGKLELGVVQGGRLYFLSHPQYRRQLLANPASYVNRDLALAGECPVCMVKMNSRVTGEPGIFALHQGLIYRFPSKEQQKEFLTSPHKYATSAHEMADSIPQPGGSGSAAAGSDNKISSPTNSTSAQNSPSLAAGSATTAGSGTTPGGSAAGGSGVSPSLPLALSGYSPVSLLDDGSWVRGNPELSIHLDGRKYLFATAEQRDRFEQHPEKYVPALGGNCVVCRKEMRREVAGSVQHAVLHQGRLFLFPGAEQKEAFKRRPTEYAQVDLANGGMSVVAQVDHDTRQPGKPELTVWYGGLRYQFVTPEEKADFLKNPSKYQVGEQPGSP